MCGIHIYMYMCNAMYIYAACTEQYTCLYTVCHNGCACTCEHHKSFHIYMCIYVLYVIHNHQVASLEKELQELESYKPDKKSHKAIQVISVQ